MDELRRREPAVTRVVAATRGKRVGLVLSDGNVDRTVFADILARDEG